MKSVKTLNFRFSTFFLVFSEVLQLLFPDLTLPSCRPGLALLALLGSRTAVTFALEDVQGRAFRYIEVLAVVESVECFEGVRYCKVYDEAAKCEDRWVGETF